MNVLGIVTCAADLHRLMRERAVAIGISREVIDDISGLADGYSAKLLAPKPIKRMGELAMAEVLPVLGAQLILIEDLDALARTLAHSKYKERNERAANHAKTVTIIFSARRLRAMQKRGGKNSRKYMSKQRASDLASHAVSMRKWRKPRVVELKSAAARAARLSAGKPRA